MNKHKHHLSLAVLAAIWCVCAVASTMRLDPGLTAPDFADGARLDAAVLVSTNASATSQVAAVYELPTYGVVESVQTLTNDYYVLSTNVVVGTNQTDQATGMYTVATNPVDDVTGIYTVTNISGVAVTNYYSAVTNYWTVWTNKFEVMVNQPQLLVVTNRSIGVTGVTAITNELLSLTASGGYAETNGVNRWIVAPARLLVTGAPVSVVFK